MEIDFTHGDRVRATMYDGQVIITGTVITTDHAHGLALVRVVTVDKTIWPYPPKVGDTPRVALQNCERIAG